MVVRRELTPSGKSRAFVNDSPVTLKVLQDLSAELIDLHQQFDARHPQPLLPTQDDRCPGGQQERLLQYRNIYREYSACQRRLSELLNRNEQSTKEMDFIHFQLEEFNKAELVAGEQETRKKNSPGLATLKTSNAPWAWPLIY